MATNAVTLFDPKASVPAHVAGYFEAEGSNIADRQTVPSLSPGGKTWTISLDGEKTKLQRRNTDGDVEPVGVMKVVILDYAKDRGRAYYEGEYDEANVSAPICWSADGKAPDDTLPGPFAPTEAARFAKGGDMEGKSRKISSACASCPMAVKGSKVTGQGKAVTACGQHRMLAVVPEFKLDMTPLRLKIAMTSDWDKQSPDQEAQGWVAFSNYMDWLKARQVKHTAALVTKMKFDPDAPYPKIFFAADRWLEPHELAIVAPVSKGDDVKKLLGGSFTPAGADGVPATQQDVAGAVAPVGALAAAGPAPVTEDPLAAAKALIAQAEEAERLKVAVAQAEAARILAEQAAKLVTVDDPLAAARALIAQAEAAKLAEHAPPATTTAPGAMIIEDGPAGNTQGLAQADAPAPTPVTQVEEKLAAAEAAGAATPVPSTNVPADVADLLAEWG